MIEAIQLIKRLLQQSASSSVIPREVDRPRSFIDNSDSSEEPEALGKELLREGRVAVLMLAGGVSTRMGGTGLRGDLVIGPVSDRSLFRLQGEKIAAIRRRYAPDLRWLVMTSPEVHRQTLASFRREHAFGVPWEAIRFFQQESLPVLDEKLDPVPMESGGYLTSPNGHGGLLNALALSDVLDWLYDAGVEYLFHFQYPNVLERVCDPVMLGHHRAAGSDVTTKGIRRYSASERVGRVVAVQGQGDREQHRIVEYHFLEGVQDLSWWNSLPASTGTHVWSLPFLQRCIDQKVELPAHRIPHRQRIHGQEHLWKVEFFAFDLFTYANQTGLVIADGEWEYSMVKNPTGADSLKTAQEDLVRMYRTWLEWAGAVPRGDQIRVEIRPHFALWVDELRQRLSPGFEYSDGLILDMPPYDD